MQPYCFSLLYQTGANTRISEGFGVRADWSLTVQRYTGYGTSGTVHSGWQAGEWMATAARIEIRVQPRASRNTITGLKDGILRIRVTAPPVNGQANAAVIALLAEALGVPKSAIRLIRGASSREKLLEVETMSQEEVNQRLNRLSS